jgi:biopolymer transport protein ExbD
MIDVTFLLIIFFLVSSHLSRQDFQVQLPLPVADSGETMDAGQSKVLVLHVQEDGEVLSGGQTIQRHQLGDLMRDRFAAADSQLEVRIRCHRRVAYRHIEPVLLAAAKSGVWNVHFAVIHPRDAR